MKIVNPITPANVIAALVASKQGGTHRATVILTRAGTDTVCHGAKTTGTIIVLIEENMSGILVNPATDVISYDDGT